MIFGPKQKKMFWDSLLKSVHDMKYDALNGRICKKKSFMKNVVLRNWKKNSRNNKKETMTIHTKIVHNFYTSPNKLKWTMESMWDIWNLL